MTAPPLLLLDVDGVLSPFGEIPRWRSKCLEPIATGGYAGTFLIDRDVTSRLARMHDSGIVEVEWCTSWESDARDFLGPFLGAPYPDLHVHYSRDVADTRVWFKQQAAQTRLDEGRRVVWCDDDIPSHDISAIADHPRLLAVEPDKGIGLTVDDLDRIDAWVTRGGEN